MSELLKKYESIDQSKLNEATIKILNRVKTITADFTADDEKNNKIAEQVLNEVMKKNPDSVKIVKRTPKAKATPKKIHKATHTPKVKQTTSSTAKSSNNIMSVAKEIQKAGESWKDAMERAKQVLKERKEQVVQKQKTELEKLFALVKTKKELQGFANSDIQRDSVRDAKPRGARVVTKQGSTSNQYGTFSNKLGRKYWETRDRHADRLAPNYPKDMPLLADGGSVGKKHLVGEFNEQQLRKGEDKIAIEKAQKETGLTYIQSKMIKKSGKPFMQVYLVSNEDYYNSNEFANGGSVNMDKHIWEGWTVGDFIEELEPTFNQIMRGSSWQKPFKTKDEVKAWAMDNQPYYKKNIPEVVNYFWAKVQSKDNYADGGMTNLTMQNVSFAKGGSIKEVSKISDFMKYLSSISNDNTKTSNRDVNKISEFMKFLSSISNENKELKSLTLKIQDDLRGVIKSLNSKEKISKEEISSIQDDLRDVIKSTESGSFANGGSVKKVPAYAKKRLEELREEIREERISTGEIAELQSMKKYIDPSDVELLQWAGVSEFEEDEDNYAKGGKITKSEVMRNMYKPSGDYFFEQKGNDLIIHLTSKDASNSIDNLMDKYDVKDNGRGYHGSSYILSRKNKLANGGSLPFMTDPNFGNFQNTGAFAKGGSVKKVPAYVKRRLEELRKEIREERISTGEIAELESLKQYIDPSDLLLLQWAGVPEFEEEEEEYTDFSQYDTIAYNLSEEDAVKLANEQSEKDPNSQIVLAFTGNGFNVYVKKDSYELGGAFMMTDLAGHTGGSDGVGSPKPLSGVSGTYYTGLVGETGAMSSGELFMDGGAMAQNQQVINDASQSYVNYYLGEGASQGIYKDGGSIPNNYEGKYYGDIWDKEWTDKQKYHFLSDHKNEIGFDEEMYNESSIKRATKRMKSSQGNDSGFQLIDSEKLVKTKSSELPRYVKLAFQKHTREGQYASGGSLGKALYVEYSSYFTSNKYDEEKIMSVLKSIGAKNIRLENDRGWFNQPEVVVFNGDKNKAQDALNEAFDTDYIRVSEKDWRTKKMADGGGIRSKEELKKIFSEKEAIVKNLTPKQIAEMWNKNSFGVKEGISKPITIEEAKRPSMKIYLENLLIENELTEEEQAKYFAKGGFVGTVEFNVGDVVWQKDEKRYATVMNNYGDAINGDGGEIRLDTTGNTMIFTYDPKTYENTGYNLVKLGEKGDTGKFTPKVLDEMKESANRLINSRKERDDTEMIEYYEGIYKRLLDGEFDSMTGAKSTTSNKKGSRDYTYVPNKDVKELSVVVKGELKKLMGSDILDGVYVKNSAKSTSKVDANAVFAKILKDAKEAKSGKTKRFDASELKMLNLEMVQKLVEAGYTEQQVRNVIFGYAFDNEILADNELEYDNGIFSYEESYVKEKIDDLVEAQKNKEFVAGIEYPDFDWQSIIKKYKITSKPKQIVIKRNFGSGSYNEYYYEVFVGENIALGHNIGYKDFESNGKLKGDYTEKGKKVSDPTKQNAWQKERGQKAGFNGGYWYVVSSKIETIDDVLKTLLSQKDGYCKELELYSDSFPKTLKENKIAFADGGEMESTDISADLEKFNIDNLDYYEYEQYNHFLPRLGKAQSLQLLINTVDGDVSQLSPELAKLAEKQGSSYAKGGMVVYLDGEKSKSFKTKKSLYEFVRSQTGTGVKKVEIDYGNRIYPTFDTYEIVDGKLIHKGEFFQKNYDKEEAEKRRLETERSLNQMMGYANGGSFTDYMNSPQYKELIEKQKRLYAQLKSRVVLAVGIDEAIEFFDYEHSSIAPYRFLERAVQGNLIALDEINEELVKSALEETKELDSDEDLQEIGSSDFTYYLKNVLEGAGFKVGFVNSRLRRLNEDGSVKEIENSYADGGFMNDVYANGGGVDDEMHKLAKSIVRGTDYKIGLYLPYRTDFYLKDKKGRFGIGSYLVLQDEDNKNEWSVAERKYEKSKGGYYEDIKSGITQKQAYELVKELINSKYADGGFMNNVYANGGDLSDVDLNFNFETEGDAEFEYPQEVEKIKLLRELVNFDEVRGAVDYGKTKDNTDLQFYKKGKLVMTVKGDYDVDAEILDTEIDILGIKHRINYHPYDSMGGLDYSALKRELNKANFADGGSLMGVHDGTAFMQNPVYAEKGSYLQDNEGFMRADNEFNYRYPEKEVYIETFDDPIDLTSTVTVKSNEVIISPIDENIDLNDDNRIRARMTQSNRGSAENFGKINPRAFEFIDLPMPISNKHKND